MLRFKKKDGFKQENYWLVDYSFFIYNGTYSQMRGCPCVVKGQGNPDCPECLGKGVVLLVNKDGFHTGGIFAVMKMILDRMKEGYKIELVFDPPKANLDRSQLIDNYKGNRGEKPAFITAQMDLGRTLFPLTKNITCLTSDTDESDDVLAARALELANQGHNVVLASDDKDEFPVLIHPLVKLWRQKAFFTKADFVTKFGFGPGRFSEYLAIVGDAADNYNLIKGLGPVAAKWFIDRYPVITDCWDDWTNIPEKYKKKLIKNCSGSTCKKCKRCENYGPYFPIDNEPVPHIKLKDELETSLKLAYLNMECEYYKLENTNNYQELYSELERLELRSALYNIDMLVDRT